MKAKQKTQTTASEGSSPKLPIALDPSLIAMALPRIITELAQSERRWEEERNLFIPGEAQRRYEAALAAELAKKAAEAAADFDQRNPRPTFEVLCDRHLKTKIPNDATRARVVAELSRRHAAKKNGDAA